MSDSIWSQTTSNPYQTTVNYSMTPMDTVNEAKEILQEIGDLLAEKNEKYGDSALNPIRLFSRGDAVDSLCVRIDDKINRIKNSGLNADTEDSVQDLIGYLVLLQVARKRKGA